MNAGFVPSQNKPSFMVASWTPYAVPPTTRNRANLTCVCRSVSFALNILAKE